MKYLDLWKCLLAKELKAKYKGTFIGYAWSVMLPLLQSLIFFCVFSVFLRFSIEHYFFYLFIGCTVWQFFSNALMQGASAMLCNANLIRKTNAPRWVFVLSVVGAETVHLLLSLPVILILMVCCGRSLHWEALWLFPLGFASICIFSLGLALIVAVVNAYFRDLERILQILLMAGFYATPVFYSLEQVPEKYHWLIKLNPVYQHIALFRSVFYQHEAGLFHGLTSLVIGIIVLQIGFLFFQRMQKPLAEVL